MAEIWVAPRPEVAVTAALTGAKWFPEMLVAAKSAAYLSPKASVVLNVARRLVSRFFIIFLGVQWSMHRWPAFPARLLPKILHKLNGAVDEPAGGAGSGPARIG